MGVASSEGEESDDEEEEEAVNVTVNTTLTEGAHLYDNQIAATLLLST